MRLIEMLRQKIPKHKEKIDVKKQTAAKILAGFMIIILVLTGLSRVADSITIPNIEGVVPKRGRLEREVEASGYIIAKNEVDITSEEGFKVKEVHVKAGEKVKKDETLIELDDKDIEEQLTQAEVDLEKIELQIKQLLIDREGKTSIGDQSSQELSIKRLEEDKIKAEETGSLVIKRSEENLMIASADLEEAKQTLEKIKNTHSEEEIEKAQEAIDKFQEDIEDKKYEKDKALKRAQMVVDDAEAQYRTIANQGVDITNALQAVEKAKDEYNIIKTDWERIIKKLEKELEEANQHLSEVQSGKINEETIKIQQEKIKIAEREVESKERALEDARQSKEDELNRIERLIEDAKLSSKEEKEKVKESQMEQEKDRNRKDIQKASLELDKKMKQEEVDKLRSLKESGGVVKAPYDGTVMEVKVEKGDKTTGNALLSIVSQETTYQLEIEVSTEQAEYLEVGDSVLVTLQGQKRPIEGVVIESIVNVVDKESEEGKKKITAILPEGEPGIKATMKIVKETDKYPHILPAGAIREDSKGKYVLAVKESVTTLGKQLVAERVDVLEVDRAGSMVAVQGAFDSKQKVITKSSKPIVAGDRVRLKEQ